MITARSYQKSEVTDLDPAEISEVVDEADRMLWVHVSDPTEEDLSCLEEEFALHPLALEDVRHRQQRPKLEQYPTHVFVVAYTASLQQVDFFMGPSWLVTVCETTDTDPPWSVNNARSRFERTRPDPPTSAFLFYILLDEIVDGYFLATEKTDDELEDLEDRIFSEQLPDQELANERLVQQELFDVRRRLLLFRRAVVPLREVVAALLRKEVEWVDEATLTHLQDVYDHVLRAVDQLDAQRELVGNAVDAHLAIINNRLSFVMKKTSSWGAIIIVSTLVAGIYGMNFERMPELHWTLGYPFALAMMAVVTLVLFLFFRRKDWL